MSVSRQKADSQKIELEKNIREIAKEKQIALRKVAVAAGMTEPTLHAILKKGDCRLSQALSIAEVLDVGLSEIVGQVAAREKNISRLETKVSPRDTAIQGVNSLEVLLDKVSMMQQLLDSKEDQIQMLKQDNARLRAELGRVDGGHDARQTG